MCSFVWMDGCMCCVVYDCMYVYLSLRSKSVSDCEFMCEWVFTFAKKGYSSCPHILYIYNTHYYILCIHAFTFNIVTQKIKRLLFSHLHILFSFSILSILSLFLSLFMCVFLLFDALFLPIIEVDHTIILYLVDPNGEFIDYYGLGKAADEIVLSVKRNMDKWEKLHANTNWFQRLFS